MKRSKLHKIWRGQNLGPIKRILAHDQVGLKIFYPKHANVAIRASGCTPAEAHKVNPDDKDVIISAKKGGISGCAPQLSALIECLRAIQDPNRDSPNICASEKAAVEACRMAVKENKKQSKELKEKIEIEGNKKCVTWGQVNRLLSWFPQEDKPREKYDNEYTNYWIKYGYFKRRPNYRPED